MSQMTREDMLRELELLPVWTLHASKLKPATIFIEAAPEAAAQKKDSTVEANQTIASIISSESKDVIIEQSDALELAVQTLKPLEFKQVASDDGDWLFVLSNTEMRAEESLLLLNILIVMRIKAKPIEMPANTLNVLSLIHPKLIIAMGEVPAQHLLQTAETLADLRGTLHYWQGVALVVTYDLQHLLQILPDKAKAWEDLCLAKATMQSIT